MFLARSFQDCKGKNLELNNKRVAEIASGAHNNTSTEITHHLDDHRRDDNAAATLRYNQPLFEHRYG